VLNRYPYNNGHLLVAPARHVARLDELTADESLEVLQTINRMVALLEQTIRAEGFNIGLNLGRIAGAGLPGHVHWHIVPRWSGDTNFMPITAGVRVIPQSLEALWEILTKELQAGSGEHGAMSREH
jgi:ATP adenylyltransferase